MIGIEESVLSMSLVYSRLGGIDRACGPLVRLTLMRLGPCWFPLVDLVITNIGLFRPKEQGYWATS